jgi:tripartite-type tricarboxylate transporter receptor subunit TctC
MISKNRRQLLLATAASTLAPWTHAQNVYPNKTIRYVVPVAAGGGADMIGRATCERMTKVLGQSIIIENVSGGGGAIACQTWPRALLMATPCCRPMWPHTVHRQQPEN